MISHPSLLSDRGPMLSCFPLPVQSDGTHPLQTDATVCRGFQESIHTSQRSSVATSTPPVVTKQLVVPLMCFHKVNNWIARGFVKEKKKGQCSVKRASCSPFLQSLSTAPSSLAPIHNGHCEGPDRRHCAPCFYSLEDTRHKTMAHTCEDKLKGNKCTFTDCASPCWERETWTLWRSAPGFILTELIA